MEPIHLTAELSLKLQACGLDINALHPWSYSVLREFVQGAMWVQEFLTKISLPDSSLIEPAACLARLMVPGV